MPGSGGLSKRMGITEKTFKEDRNPYKRLTAEKAFKRDGFPKKRLLQRMDCEGKRMGFLNKRDGFPKKRLLQRMAFKRDGFPKKRPLTKNGNP